jgi:hypothetical protein
MLEILVGPGAELRKKIIAKGIISRWIHLRMLPKTRSFVDFACRGRVRVERVVRRLCARGDSHRTPPRRERRRGVCDHVRSLFRTSKKTRGEPGHTRLTGHTGTRITQREPHNHPAPAPTPPTHTVPGLGRKLVAVTLRSVQTSVLICTGSVCPGSPRCLFTGNRYRYRYVARHQRAPLNHWRRRR